MLSQKCAFCPNMLDENKSKEHVIPNSIGGKKVTTKFICDKCNKSLGKSWDSELAKQLQWFSLAIGIVRERGDTPGLYMETTAGEQVYLQADGSFIPVKKAEILSEKIDGNRLTVHAKVRTDKEAKEIVRGMARKYPEFDLTNSNKELVYVKDYLESPVEFSLEFGGPEAGRSYVKSAMALAYDQGIIIDCSSRSMKYLLGDNNQIPFGFYYLKDLIVNRNTYDTFHCVAIKGFSDLGKLIAYVEYFGVCRVLVELSDSYKGNDVSIVYAINPATGEEVDVCVDLSLAINDVDSALRNQAMPCKEYSGILEASIKYALDRAEKRERDRVIVHAMEKTCEELGVEVGGYILPHQYEQFSRLVADKLRPYITRLKMNGRKDLLEFEFNKSDEK